VSIQSTIDVHSMGPAVGGCKGEPELAWMVARAARDVEAVAAGEAFVEQHVGIRGEEARLGGGTGVLDKAACEKVGGRIDGAEGRWRRRRRVDAHDLALDGIARAVHRPLEEQALEGGGRCLAGNDDGQKTGSRLPEQCIRGVGIALSRAHRVGLDMHRLEKRGKSRQSDVDLGVGGRVERERNHTRPEADSQDAHCPGTMADHQTVLTPLVGDRAPERGTAGIEQHEDRAFDPLPGDAVGDGAVHELSDGRPRNGEQHQ
jgi:hypothetical protein